MNLKTTARSTLRRGFFIALALFFVTLPARADYDDRFELGLGYVSTNAQSGFEAGVEYEHRFMPILGVGVTANYAFLDPGLFLLAVPNFFVHPTGGDWLVSGAPLLQWTGNSMALGARFGVRIPIPLGRVELIPEAAIDLIANGPITTIGLGIGF